MNRIIDNDGKKWMIAINNTGTQTSVVYRNHDLPAYICRRNYDLYWYNKKGTNRENSLPATIWGSGTKHWMVNNDWCSRNIKNKYFRNIPCIIYSRGSRSYCS